MDVFIDKKGEVMTFTNIQVYNSANKFSKEELEERLKKFKQDIKIIFSESSKFVTIYDSEYTFKSLPENKSYIRKLAKILTLPVFSITCLQNSHVIIEQYNFNKRIYDYLSIGDMNDEIIKLGYENINSFNNINIWEEYFVGRNKIENLNKIIDQRDTYIEKSYIIEDIFKLYGLSKENSLYHI